MMSISHSSMESSPNAACAAMEPARTVWMIVMASNSEADQLKQKRRKAARTLLIKTRGDVISSCVMQHRKASEIFVVCSYEYM